MNTRLRIATIMAPLSGIGTAVAVAEQRTAAIQPIIPAETVPTPPPQVMTLAELEQIALANNPTMNQAGARIRALQGKQLQVGLYPNPVIGYIGDEMGNEGTAGQQGGFLRQEIRNQWKTGIEPGRQLDMRSTRRNMPCNRNDGVCLTTCGQVVMNF